MAIDNDALLAAIDAGRESSYGTDENSELGRQRAKSLEYYFGLNTDPAPEGRSQIVDRSVYETISVMMPSLVRIFAGSSDEVCKFMPVGPEDEKAAELTTALISHVVTQQNQWEQIAADWIHDAMLLSNGYAMAYWDESEKTIREVYEGQSDDQIAALLEDTNVRVLQHTQQIDEQSTADAMKAWQQAMQQYQQALPQMQAQAAQMQAQGQQVPPMPPPPQQPQPIVAHDVVIERIENEGKVCIKVIPPEHCYVSMGTPDWTLRDCPYFEVRQEKTIADLRAMGLDVDEDVSDDEEDTEEDDARNRFGEDTDSENSVGVMRRVWTRMIWLRGDIEGDGISRLYYVLAVGRTILYVEPCAQIPVASMTPQPLPHRHIGMSIAETVWDIQDMRTAVTRGGLDSMYLANNGRYVVSSRVNLDDMLDSRSGALVRMLDDSLPAEGHIMPLTHPVIFDQSIATLEYLDQVRQNRTGASRYFSGTDANAINKTASGTMALQNMASMRVEHLARMMAPAVEALFCIVHEVISKHQNKALTIKLKGQWTTIDPQAWRTKRDVRISVGVGAGNKESMMGQLGALFGAQMQLGPMGLAGPRELHATVVEMAKLAGFANPDKFWTDPAKTPPQPPQPPPEIIKTKMQIDADMQAQQLQAQQEQQKFQAEQVIEQQRMQQQAELDQNREEMQARQKQLELQQTAQLEQMRAAYEAAQAQKELEFRKWEAELKAMVQLQIAEMKDKPDLSKQDGAIEQLMAKITEMVEEMNAPAQLVRDEGGRAVAVQKGSKVRKIQRGPDGRAIGVQ